MLNEDGCLFCTEDDMVENKQGVGCKLTQKQIEKRIKYYQEVVVPDMINQMGGFVDFLKKKESHEVKS